MKHRMGLASILTLTLLGCGNERDPTMGGGWSGTLVMALSATEGRTSYRLVEASFEINGPSSQTVVSEPEDRVLEVVLPIGDYTITLLDGWSMESSSGGEYTPVPAVLKSPVTQGFVIHDQETTQVTFSFRSGEDVIELGNGRLVVEIEVNPPEPSADGSPAVSIDCAIEFCTGTASDACCYGNGGPLGCTELDACVGDGLYAHQCDDRLDCGGDPCCIDDTATLQAACSATCASGFEVCSLDDPRCPPGTLCTATDLVPFFVCAPPP